MKTSEANNTTDNHHSNYNFSDYLKYIKNVAYNFSIKTNIDIDEFVSEAGLVWAELIQIHDPEISNFIASFKGRYKQACLTLIAKHFRIKNGGKTHTTSIDKRMSDTKQTLHDFVSAPINPGFNFAMLSDTAKQIITQIAKYKENTGINNDTRKQQINAMQSEVKKQHCKNKYNKAIKEICELLPGSRPTKSRNTFPIVFKECN